MPPRSDEAGKSIRVLSPASGIPGTRGRASQRSAPSTRILAAARLGRHLALRRELLGLTVEEAADRAGLTPFGVRAVEAGRGWPKYPAAHLAALADALEMPKTAVSLKLADDSVLLAEVDARRLRGGLYGGPAKRLCPSLARSVSRARGTAPVAPVSGPPRPLASHASAGSAPIVDTSVSTSTPTPES